VHGPLDVIHLAAIRGTRGLSELTDYTAFFVTKEVVDEVKGQLNDALGGQAVPIRFAPPGSVLEKDASVLLVVSDTRGLWTLRAFTGLQFEKMRASAAEVIADGRLAEAVKAARAAPRKSTATPAAPSGSSKMAKLAVWVKQVGQELMDSGFLCKAVGEGGLGLCREGYEPLGFSAHIGSVLSGVTPSGKGRGLQAQIELIDKELNLVRSGSRLRQQGRSLNYNESSPPPGTDGQSVQSEAKSREVDSVKASVVSGDTSTRGYRSGLLALNLPLRLAKAMAAEGMSRSVLEEVPIEATIEELRRKGVHVSEYEVAQLERATSHFSVNAIRFSEVSKNLKSADGEQMERVLSASPAHSARSSESVKSVVSALAHDLARGGIPSRITRPMAECGVNMEIFRDIGVGPILQELMDRGVSISKLEGLVLARVACGSGSGVESPTMVRRRDALDLESSGAAHMPLDVTQPGRCMYGECTRSVYVNPGTGVVSEFCGRTHLEAARAEVKAEALANLGLSQETRRFDPMAREMNVPSPGFCSAQEDESEAERKGAELRRELSKMEFPDVVQLLAAVPNSRLIATVIRMGEALRGSNDTPFKVETFDLNLDLPQVCGSVRQGFVLISSSVAGALAEHAHLECSAQAKVMLVVAKLAQAMRQQERSTLSGEGSAELISSDKAAAHRAAERIAGNHAAVLALQQVTEIAKTAFDDTLDPTAGKLRAAASALVQGTNGIDFCQLLHQEKLTAAPIGMAFSPGAQSVWAMIGVLVPRLHDARKLEYAELFPRGVEVGALLTSVNTGLLTVALLEGKEASQASAAEKMSALMRSWPSIIALLTEVFPRDKGLARAFMLTGMDAFDTGRARPDVAIELMIEALFKEYTEQFKRFQAGLLPLGPPTWAESQKRTSELANRAANKANVIAVGSVDTGTTDQTSLAAITDAAVAKARANEVIKAANDSKARFNESERRAANARARKASDAARRAASNPLATA